VADEEHLQPPVVRVSEVEAESGVVAVSELADRQQVDRVRLALDPGNLQFNYTRAALSVLVPRQWQRSRKSHLIASCAREARLIFGVNFWRLAPAPTSRSRIRTGAWKLISFDLVKALCLRHH